VVKADEVVAVIETSEELAAPAAPVKPIPVKPAAAVNPEPLAQAVQVMKATPSPAESALAPIRAPRCLLQNVPSPAAKPAANRCHACAAAWQNGWSPRSTAPPCSPRLTK